MRQLRPQRPAIIGEPVRPHAELDDGLLGTRRDVLDGVHIGFGAVHAGRAWQLRLQQREIDAGIIQHGLDAFDVGLPVGQAGKSGIERIADDGADA